MSQKRCSNQDYLLTFADNPGVKVLKELRIDFYDRPSYVQGDPYETAKREGERAVILRILDKIKQARNPKLKQLIADEMEQ